MDLGSHNPFKGIKPSHWLASSGVEPKLFPMEVCGKLIVASSLVTSRIPDMSIRAAHHSFARILLVMNVFVILLGQTASLYRVGVGIADVTGPAAGINMASRAFKPVAFYCAIFF